MGLFLDTKQQKPCPVVFNNKHCKGKGIVLNVANLFSPFLKINKNAPGATTQFSQQ
jgi:predicted methyltransferase